MGSEYQFIGEPPALNREELAYRMEWQGWRSTTTEQLRMLNENQKLKLDAVTIEIKDHMDEVIRAHEEKEMNHLRKINTFMFQTKIVGALAVIGLGILTQTTGLFS